MFGLPISNLWLILGIIAALGAGVAWHESKVSDLKASVLNEERLRVAHASQVLAEAEDKRARETEDTTTTEEIAEEREDADRERQLTAALARIEQLEKGRTQCGISRDTVRELNR